MSSQLVTVHDGHSAKMVKTKDDQVSSNKIKSIHELSWDDIKICNITNCIICNNNWIASDFSRMSPVLKTSCSYSPLVQLNCPLQPSSLILQKHNVQYNHHTQTKLTLKRII